MITTFILQFTILAPPILLALTVHEFAHGYTAYRFGDPTAKNLGRLSLNPLKHLDPIGTIAFFIIHLGWAKPVPVNPRYFKDPRKDMLWVALAGPAVNLFLAILSAILLKIVMVVINATHSHLILYTLGPFAGMLEASVWINIVLCVFNFLPIPPLDGSKILMGLLPAKQAQAYASIERYGFVIVLLLAASGILSKMIHPIIVFANNLLV